jgi:hypothetical protein
MHAALHGGAAIWRPSIGSECDRSALGWIRGLAVAGAASDKTSRNAIGRDEVFIVKVLDCLAITRLALET